MAGINSSVYNYYLNAYSAQLRQNRYDSHKKSELKDVYNRMVRTNKNSPLYKIKFTRDVAEFAIDLKESAHHMQNVVASLSTEDSGIESVFHKKIATSSNTDAVEVTYVGPEDGETNSTFYLGVDKLATPQVNEGNYLPASKRSFEPGSYSFNLQTTAHSYEFQFNVDASDTNKQIQTKIARLVNTSDVGLRAQVMENRGMTALRLTSRQTGLAENEEFLFKITTDNSWNELNTLGIANVASEASSSDFKLNGNEHHSLSNNFTINHAFELTLKDTTPEDQPAKIGFKANTEAIADSVEELLTSYNGFIAVGQKYSTKKGNNQLLNEISGLARGFSKELSQVGISVGEDKNLTLDRDTITQAVTGEKSGDTFRFLNRFKESLSREANKTSINPLNYVDKVAVEYKNPGKTWAAPYAASVYAGLLVDEKL